MIKLPKMFRKNDTKRYSKKDIEFIISRILRETVDREILRKCFEEFEMAEIIGRNLLNQLYEAINEKEKKSDCQKIDNWMKYLEEGLSQ